MKKIRHKAKAILLAWVKHLVKKENQHNNNIFKHTSSKLYISYLS